MKGYSARVNVEFLENTWVVKNHGDSTVLFKSTNKKAAERFAKEMAEAHEIGLKVYPANERSSSPIKASTKLKVDIEKREGMWHVRIHGKTPEFTSTSKEEAIQYANTLDSGNGLDLHIDKD